jgi:prephenate dehydrogenase
MDAELAGKKFAVIGAGQIGGSFALALRRFGLGESITVVEKPENIDPLLASGIFDCVTVDLGKGIAGADVIFLAVPVPVILDLLPRIAAEMKPSSVLLDAGSTKLAVAECMRRFPRRILVAGHPMAGTERSGFQAADPGLFYGRPYLLSFPTAKSRDGRGLILALLREIGFHPLEVEPGRHDRIAAFTSHLPYVLSLCYGEQAARRTAADDLVPVLTAGGFRDALRLSRSELEMGLGILQSNREKILACLDDFCLGLEDFRQKLDSRDWGELKNLMREAGRVSSLFV